VAPKTYWRKCGADCPCGGGSVVAKMKGVQRATREDFDAFVRGDGVSRTRQVSPKEMIRSGILEPHEVEVLKVMRGLTRPKRAPEGDATRPWTVNELERKWHANR
jgi:hypothetical protein